MKSLKSTAHAGIIVIVAIMGFAATPAFANNWQWELGQIKANQLRAEQRRATAQATRVIEKSATERNKPEAENAKRTATPSVK